MKLALSFRATWLFTAALVAATSAIACGDGGSGSGGSTSTGGSGTGGATGGTATGGSTGGATGGTTTGGTGGSTGGTATGGTGGAASLCTTSGGTEGTALCCQATGDFPNGCGTGPCGCAPASSHEVKVCNCPANQCFDPVVGCKSM
jgi:hypothetical protein